MVMDSLSLRQAEDFLEVNADKVDLLKLGFGTSIVTPNVKEKSNSTTTRAPRSPRWHPVRSLLRSQPTGRLPPLVDDFGLETVEVSDGSMVIEEDAKCR